MGRITRLFIGAVFGSAVIAGSQGSAGAEPNPSANCNGIYSFFDAQNGDRDEVSHILKEIAVEQGITPGTLHRFDKDEPC